MRRDVLVYISGPMTARDGFTIEENVAAGLRVFLELLDAGIPAYCPHLSGAFPSAWSAIAWERWLAYDYAIIDRCTHVLMLPRWESSTGARAEREYATRRALPIAYSMPALLAAIVRAEP
jgi:hypothetical protein